MSSCMRISRPGPPYPLTDRQAEQLFRALPANSERIGDGLLALISWDGEMAGMAEDDLVSQGRLRHAVTCTTKLSNIRQ